MLAFVIALSLAQQADAPPPPPPPPPSTVDAPTADAPPPPVSRSAKLMTPPQSPRVGGGVLAGRMVMGTLLGTLGFGVAGAVAAGVVLGSFLAGSYTGIIIAPIVLAVLSPVILGLGIFSVALGAAMFGQHYGIDFRDALKVSAVLTPIASALAGGLMLLMAYVSPIGILVVPIVCFLGLTVSVPLIVQALKPDDDEVALRPAPNPAGGGLTFAF